MESLSELDALQATKYLSGAALTLVLYDHLIHLDTEVSLVWRQPPTVLSVFIMTELYVREIGLAYLAAAALQTRHVICAVSTYFTIAYSLLSTGSVHSLLLYRVYRLWDNRIIVKYLIIAGFLVSFGGTIACAIRAANSLANSVVVPPQSHFCVFPNKSWFETASWAIVIVYDLGVLVLVVMNTLSKPRRRDMDIIKSLYTDGFLIFLAFLALRISRLLPSIFGGGDDMLLTPLISWAFEGVLNTRLYFKVKELDVYRAHWTPFQVGEQHSRQRSGVLVYEETEMNVL